MFLKRTWVIGLVTLLTLSVGLALGPATAVAADRASANRAASWLIAQLTAGHLPGVDSGSEFGNTALGLIGVAAADDLALQPGIDAMVAYLKANGPALGTTSARAAALGIAADALDLAPSAFGVDPLAAIAADTQPDGSIGSWPNAYGQGFALLGIARAGGTPSEAQVTWLVGQQDASGAFGYNDYVSGAFVADPDSTAMAVLGLATSKRTDADTAAASAASWLADNQQADGSWAAYAPVNTTALAAMALADRGLDASAALAYLRSHQDAAGALLFDGDPDVYATSQAMIALAGHDYRTVVWTPRSVTPSVSASPSVSPSTTPTAMTTASAAPAPTATVTVTKPRATTTTRVATSRGTTGGVVTTTVTSTATTPATASPTPSALETPTATSTPSAVAAAASGSPTTLANGDLPWVAAGGAMAAAAAVGGALLLRRR